MNQRSPALGYNHNVRHAERVWHVQTEDSGVQRPHIFTHLFHQGTILASKRTDYDPAIDVEQVQRLMQVQHKTMLRELKDGRFDEKIAQFLRGSSPASGASQVSTLSPTAQRKEEFEDSPRTTPSEDVPDTIRTPATPMTRPNAPAAPRSPIAAQPARPVSTARTVPTARPVSPTRPVPTGKPIPTTTARATSPRSPAPLPQATRPTGPGLVPSASRIKVPAGTKSAPQENNVVTRPAVIVGAPANKPPAKRDMFGSESPSEKSLDEVILAYLSEEPKKDK